MTTEPNRPHEPISYASAPRPSRAWVWWLVGGTALALLILVVLLPVVFYLFVAGPKPVVRPAPAPPATSPTGPASGPTGR